MVGLLPFVPLACDGCFKGYPAIISTVLITVLLIGSIYMLLWSNFGARVGYLIVMVSLGAYMVFMSLLWLIGGPGTTTGTGPRGREPAWIPFKADSEVAAEFRQIIDDFPNGWDVPDPATPKEYPGKISGEGEVTAATHAIQAALANDDLVNERPNTESDDWAFRRPGVPPVTPAERALPVGTIGYRFVGESGPLIFGVTIPATDDHREVTVFAYRDEGLIYLYSVYFLVVSLLIFVLHLWLLARHELRSRAREAQLDAATATA